MTHLPQVPVEGLKYPRIFEAVSAHLSTLEERLVALEKASHHAVGNGADLAPEVITKLQDFDHLRQSLADLALLFDLLVPVQAENAGATTDVSEIIENLQMAQTKALLATDQSAQTNARHPQAGDAQLF